MLIDKCRGIINAKEHQNAQWQNNDKIKSKIN